MTGAEARARLRATVDGGGVIIGAGAGTGLSAKCAQDGGADLIIIYNSGRYGWPAARRWPGCCLTGTQTRS